MQTFPFTSLFQREVFCVTWPKQFLNRHLNAITNHGQQLLLKRKQLFRAGREFRAKLRVIYLKPFAMLYAMDDIAYWLSCCCLGGAQLIERTNTKCVRTLWIQC